MRERLFHMVEKARPGDNLSRIYDWFIMVVAVISVVPMMFRTEHPAISVIETITIYLLFFDFIIRWITHDYRVGKHSPLAFVFYIFTPYAIMDLLAILPSLHLLPQGFMILRLLRLTKLFHYSNSFKHIVNVFKKEKKTLTSVLLIAVVYIFVSALFMFVHEPAENFPTFFDALYWATTALTTVGYGDIYPSTEIGKCISMFSSLFGVAIIAMPAGIVTGGFLEELQKSKSSEKDKEDSHEE